MYNIYHYIHFKYVNYTSYPLLFFNCSQMFNIKYNFEKNLILDLEQIIL